MKTITENLTENYTVETSYKYGPGGFTAQFDAKHAEGEKLIRLVVDNTRDLEWLAKDIFSTPYATIRVD